MKDEVKRAAIKLAEQEGLMALNREALCESVGLSPGSFSHVMGMSFTQFVEELRKEGHTGPLDGEPKSRISPELRKEQVLHVTIELGKVHGLQNLTREMIASKAQVSLPMIGKYFGSLDGLKGEAMDYAVSHNVPELIAQGLALKHDAVINATPEVKAEAIKYLLK